MASGSTGRGRVRVDGKFFRLGEGKFYPKGVAYGPFARNDRGEPFASEEQTRHDFGLLQELGANLLRVYAVPPRGWLDLAEDFGLKVLIDIPWNRFRCFLDSAATRREAREQVRQGTLLCAAHPAVFAYSVVNEIPADIVRWSGKPAIEGFVEDLIDVAKQADPDCLCTFGNFPPTEFLHPRNVDFVTFNVYLHQQRAFENYLARLQMVAETKPLVLGEFGIDACREGEAAQAAILGWQIEAAFRGGAAGTVVFSFTDDWVHNDQRVEDWFFGLTTDNRQPKPAFAEVKRQFAAAPYFPLAHTPKVSVVVACYNGARTLRTCLDSLERLNYPDYEVILVDDGSTDGTREIAAQFDRVRYFRQENYGLSVARNTGIAAASGDIIAFTDADCRADEDWLYYCVGDLVANRFAAIGGHNLLPVDDSPVAAAVMASPGGPAHVMLTDRVAEHIPGCNMLFSKWALEDIGGFDPMFRIAGDDVDICWRLQEFGYTLGFNSAGFVWHYRRSTVRDYLRQQQGYGEAEALLERKHPEYFNFLGGSMWRGRIYAANKAGVVPRQPIIYHGVFGTGFFQTLYAGQPAFSLMLCTTLEYHVLVTLPLIVLSVPFPFLLPVALTTISFSLGVCLAAAFQADVPRNKRQWWTRPLIALLFLLQPLARGWARYRGRIKLEPLPDQALERMEQLAARDEGAKLEHLLYRSDGRLDRLDFIKAILRRLQETGWPHKPDAGWSEHDLEIYGTRWSRLQLLTAREAVAPDKVIFRCRLRAGWSLQGKLALWAALGIQLLFIGLVGRDQPWLWMLLLTLPVFAWFLEQEKRMLQHLAAAFLDDVARQRGLIKMEFHPETGEVQPVAGAAAKPRVKVVVRKAGPVAVTATASAVAAAAEPPQKIQ